MGKCVAMGKKGSMRVADELFKIIGIRAIDNWIEFMVFEKHHYDMVVSRKWGIGYIRFTAGNID